MDIGSILIGVIIGGAFLYAIYDHFKPASGVRARNAKGHFKKDDKATPTINEAYKDGKTPKKRKAPVKKKVAVKKKAVAKKAPAKRGRPRKTVKKLKE